MANRKWDYDIIILGGGSAGIVSGVMAGALGMRVLLIEKGKLGGECLNTGCVPSKALLHAAKVAHTARTAAQIGFTPITISREDAAGVLRHVRATIGVVREADATEKLLRDQGVDIRFGAARFRDAHTLELDGETLTAANFVLATGSRPAVPDIPGLTESGFLTNRTIFDLDAIPETLLVVGGGPNGVEMAQAFQRLGSRVTLIEEQGRLLQHDDSELAGALEAFLRAEGVDIRLNATLASVRRAGDHCVAVIRQGETITDVACDRIFVAVGRIANVEGLGLEAAGVASDEKGVPVNAHLQTSAPNIYACGDLLGHDQFSHLAEYEAKTAVRNIVFPGASRAAFRLRPWATFTDPEVAHLGLTEDEARAQGIPYELYKQPFAQNDRALTDNDGRGFVKVLTQGLGGKILGVQIIGPRASELMQEWTLAMEHGYSIRAIADLIHLYPTLSMACQHAAQRWYERKAREPLVGKALAAYVQRLRPYQTAIALSALGASLVGTLWGLRRKAWDKQEREGMAGRDGETPPRQT